MPKDLLNRDNFGLLPEPEGRWGSFGISMVTNIIIMSLLILLTAAIHKVEKQKYNETLIFPQEVPPPPKIVVPKVKVFAPPQPEVVKTFPRPSGPRRQPAGDYRRRTSRRRLHSFTGRLCKLERAIATSRRPYSFGPPDIAGRF